jgi:hypothetical protein
VAGFPSVNEDITPKKRRMKTLVPLVTASTVLLTISCGTPQAKPLFQNVATPSNIPGAYRLTEVPGLKLQLLLHSNGTYDATSRLLSAPQEKEQGTWKTEGQEIHLRPTNGQTSHPIRQLRPDPQKPGNLLWVVPGIVGQGALTYFSLEKEPR